MIREDPKTQRMIKNYFRSRPSRGTPGSRMGEELPTVMQISALTDQCWSSGHVNNLLTILNGSRSLGEFSEATETSVDRPNVGHRGGREAKPQRRVAEILANFQTGPTERTLSPRDFANRFRKGGDIDRNS